LPNPNNLSSLLGRYPHKHKGLCCGSFPQVYPQRATCQVVGLAGGSRSLKA